MTAAALVADLEARGIQFIERAGALVIRPASAVSQAERAVIRAVKSDVLALLRNRALSVDWTKVNLYQLDKVIEVWIPWSDTRLLIAPGCRVAKDLRQSELKPGRVWCVCEVIDLLLTNVLPEDARNIATTKLVFDGRILGVRPLDGQGKHPSGEVK